MLNIFNKTLTLCFIIFINSFITIGQTYVSGVIDTNTTWTKINSPYIVTDTVFIVGISTLTIEPGVLIKFEQGKSIVLQEGSIEAEGSSIDSIRFTSNLNTPGLSSWQGITFKGILTNSKFSYCNFNFAASSLNGCNSSTVHLKNCTFESNYNAISIAGILSMYYYIDSCLFINNTGAIICEQYVWFVKMTNSRISNNITGIRMPGGSRIENCIIDNNVLGVFLYSNQDTIINCQIINNSGTGVEQWGYNTNSLLVKNNIIENNHLGYQLHGLQNDSNQIIICNHFCNNSSYDFDFFNIGAEIHVFNNDWCSNDSATIASHIRDGNDTLSGLSQVRFIPFDTLECYLNTGIIKNQIENKLLYVFPNPANDYLSLIYTADKTDATIKIYSILGELEYFSLLKNHENVIKISELSDGIYILQLSLGNKNVWQKFIKQ